MTHLNLNVSTDVAKLILADRLAVFQGQQMDEVLYREMSAHLNANVHPMIGQGFSVAGNPRSGGVNVEFFTGGNRMTVAIDGNEIREREEAVRAEIELLVDAAAQLSKDAVDMSRNLVHGGHGRWLNIANTHLQQGFSALRRAHSEEDPDAY